jgi:hypothetical protein
MFGGTVCGLPKRVGRTDFAPLRQIFFHQIKGRQTIGTVGIGTLSVQISLKLELFTKIQDKIKHFKTYSD